MLEEMRVNCVPQLLVESVQTWWTAVRNRRPGETLKWVDFGREFKVRYYS